MAKHSAEEAGDSWSSESKGKASCESDKTRFTGFPTSSQFHDTKQVTSQESPFLNLRGDANKPAS